MLAGGAIGSGWLQSNSNDRAMNAQKQQFQDQLMARLRSVAERQRRGQGLLGQMPDLERIYGDYGLTPESINNIYDVNRATQAYDPEKLKEVYAQQRALLGQAQAQQVSQAQSSAGAQASSRGLANPSAFIQQSAAPIQQMYARQVGELGARETDALRQLAMERFGAEQRMREGGFGARQGLAGLLAQLRQQGFQNRMGIEQFMGQEGYTG